MTKKLIPLIVLVAGILLACQDKTAYTINGKVAQLAYDGTYAYMQEIGELTITKIDSALIKDGKFTFEGKTQKPFVINIALDVTAVESDNELGRSILVEPEATIFMLFDKTISVSGTPINEDFSGFKDKERACLGKFIKLTSEYEEMEKKGSITKEYQKNFETEYGKVMTELRQYSYEFISNNADNKLGEYEFYGRMRSFPSEQQRALLEKFGDEFKQRPKVESLIKDLNEPEKAPVGSKFIDLTMKDINGKEITLASHVEKNKLLLVDFWASWCMPCLRAIPHLKELYESYKNRGLDVVGISLDNEEAAWKKAIKDYQIPWQNMSELQIKSKGAEAYGVKGIPFMLLINKEGVIIAKNPEKEELEKLLEELLK